MTAATRFVLLLAALPVMVAVASLGFGVDPGMATVLAIAVGAVVAIAFDVV